MALIAGTETAVEVARPGQRPWGTLVETFPQGITQLDPAPSAQWPWFNGLVLTSDPCGDISGTSIACTGSDLPDAEFYGDEETFQPFVLDVGRQCGVLSGRSDAELTEAARRRIREWISARLARELYLGTITGNPAITVNPVVIASTGVAIGDAFIALEAEIQALAGNMQMTFHLTPGLLVAALRDSVVMMHMDGTLHTATGHLVVADAGYDGSIPTGTLLDPDGAPIVPSAVGAGEAYVYVTGPVAWDYGPELISDVEDVGPLSGRTNRRRSLVQRPVVAIFDPNCVHLAILATATQ